jgi:hypothetical protein
MRRDKGSVIDTCAYAYCFGSEKPLINKTSEIRMIKSRIPEKRHYKWGGGNLKFYDNLPRR